MGFDVRTGVNAGLLDVFIALIFQLANALIQRDLELFHLVVDAPAIHIGHDVGGEVQHLLQRAGRDVQQQRQRRRNALQIPDVADGRGQLNMAHALAADFGAGDFDAAAVADDALELDLLVAPAVALPVLDRAEDALAEQAVALRLERTVVDGLRLLDFAVRPGADLVRRGDSDPNFVKCAGICHVCFAPRKPTHISHTKTGAVNLFDPPPVAKGRLAAEQCFGFCFGAGQAGSQAPSSPLAVAVVFFLVLQVDLFLVLIFHGHFQAE